MTFYKSKNKIYLLIICLVLMLIGIPLLLKILHVIHSISVYIASDSVFLPFALKNVLNQRKQRLIVAENIVFLNSTESPNISININNIKSLKYKGIPFIPMSEMLVIESDNMDVIYVDFNFASYKSVWKYILNICTRNPDINIDERIYKRLKRVN